MTQSQAASPRRSPRRRSATTSAKARTSALILCGPHRAGAPRRAESSPSRPRPKHAPDAPSACARRRGGSPPALPHQRHRPSRHLQVVGLLARRHGRRPCGTSTRSRASQRPQRRLDAHHKARRGVLEHLQHTNLRQMRPHRHNIVLTSPIPAGPRPLLGDRQPPRSPPIREGSRSLTPWASRSLRGALYFAMSNGRAPSKPGAAGQRSFARTLENQTRNRRGRRRCGRRLASGNSTD